MSDRPIGRLRAYAAGADAYDRGEPAQPSPLPSPTIAKARGSPGGTDQKAFMEGPTTRSNPSAGSSAPPAPCQPRHAGRHDVPLLCLLAVSWWLVVIGSAGLAFLGTWAVWEHLSEAYTHRRYWRAGPLPHPTRPCRSRLALSYLLFSLLPLLIVAAIRRIVMGRWPLRPALVALARLDADL